ncbi:hypothetical protein KEM48_010985 [Puccinia striiformis f. sp. tritici PST-130]|nr:hypothetical protein KEM48_010985 [Puccinia striiformis f. sp. tritici PST-130]
MALRNPESTELEEMADEDSDDPIDMLSPSQRLVLVGRQVHLETFSILTQPNHRSSTKMRSQVGISIELHLSKPKPKFRRRKWPESLTPAQQIVVDEGLRADNSIVYDLPGASCGRKELQKLSSPTHWLNDEIINFYGSLINLNSSDPKTSGDEALNVHCFSSFFMIQFDLGGHPKKLRRYIKTNIKLRRMRM